MILEDIYNMLDLHFKRADQTVAEILQMQLTAQVFEAFESIKTELKNTKNV